MVQFALEQFFEGCDFEVKTICQLRLKIGSSAILVQLMERVEPLR